MKNKAETNKKFGQLLALEKIEAKDLEVLTPEELEDLCTMADEKLETLSGAEAAAFQEKVNVILATEELWESRRGAVTAAVASYVKQNADLPNSKDIALITGMDRDIVWRHLLDAYARPFYGGQEHVLMFMASEVLSKLCKAALEGDLAAGQALIKAQQALRKPKEVVMDPNNYIIVNTHVVYQRDVDLLKPEVRQRIAEVVTGALN